MKVHKQMRHSGYAHLLYTVYGLLTNVMEVWEVRGREVIESSAPSHRQPQRVVTVTLQSHRGVVA